MSLRFIESVSMVAQNTLLGEDEENGAVPMSVMSLRGHPQDSYISNDMSKTSSLRNQPYTLARVIPTNPTAATLQANDPVP